MRSEVDRGAHESPALRPSAPAVITTGLYVLLADRAIETFWSGSPVRRGSLPVWGCTACSHLPLAMLSD
jgi:hypothetical protein